MMYRSSFARTLEGIKNATNADLSIIQLADRALSSVSFQEVDASEISLECKLGNLPTSNGPEDHIVTHVTRLALAISFLRARGFEAIRESVSDREMTVIWEILRDALQSPLYRQVKVGRSHQGFLSLPFCVLVKADGLNDECWRLHIWLPSTPQLDPRLMLHSHKSFAQSWILAGEAENTEFVVTPATNDKSATNAIYKLAAAFDKALAPGSDEELSGSVIHNTGKEVVVEEAHRHQYCHGQSYVVPGDVFHTTIVGSKTILATIFFFDAARGFFKEAGIPIGPLDGTEFTQYRNPEGTQSEVLVKIIEASRRWESLTEKAVEHACNRAWKAARGMFDKAAELWQTDTAPLRNTDSITVAKDLQDLDIYKSVAEALSAWATVMGDGELDRARRICEPFSQFCVVKSCLLITSRMNS